MVIQTSLIIEDETGWKKKSYSLKVIQISTGGGIYTQVNLSFEPVSLQLTTCLPVSHLWPVPSCAM